LFGAASPQISAALDPLSSSNTVKVTDQNNGKYSVAYNIKVAQEYTFTIKADGATIPGFPMTLKATPGTCCAPLPRRGYRHVVELTSATPLRFRAARRRDRRHQCRALPAAV